MLAQKNPDFRSYPPGDLPVRVLAGKKYLNTPELEPYWMHNNKPGSRRKTWQLVQRQHLRREIRTANRSAGSAIKAARVPRGHHKRIPEGKAGSDWQVPGLMADLPVGRVLRATMAVLYPTVWWAPGIHWLLRAGNAAQNGCRWGRCGLHPSCAGSVQACPYSGYGKKQGREMPAGRFSVNRTDPFHQEHPHPVLLWPLHIFL